MNTPEGFALMNWETGYGDWIAEPVWDTLRVLPWLEKTALVLSDTYTDEDHQEIPVSPRTILKRQVARATAMGFTVKAGSEFEFYVLRDSWEELSEAGWRVPRTFGYYNEDYHLLQATKAEPLHRLLRNQMTEARVPVEFSKGEAAPGQHEVNIRYDDVLESADRSVIFKHGAKEIAYLNGWGLTFMAKPDHHWTGSSGHLHMSVWNDDGSRALMYEEGSQRPYGMTDTMAWFLAGMMALSRELAVFIAPNINSYKRYASLSWAPVNVVWGRDNRTTGFRVVGRGDALHIEDRFPGGDMNAYLTYAAMIGAGLWGIEQKLEPPAEFRGNGYVATGVPRMPRALYEAIAELEHSRAAVEIFGQDVVDHYLNAARVEQQTYDSVVHNWDRERYLERS
jgi:glutamine synthetase